MKPTAIMVDIDGTLAHMVDRSPYDTTRYHTDKVDEVIRRLVALCRESAHFVIVVMSGRSEDFREVTVKWLNDNGIVLDELFMRPSGDLREDSIVKKELYETHVKPRYKVDFVLDDRNRVVKMWRENGLVCLQVADGNF